MHKNYNYKIKVLFLILLLFFSTIIISNYNISKASTNELWVDYRYHYPDESDGTLNKPYATIQAAIDAAKNGDTIKVLGGYYSQDLKIDKSVSIVAQDEKTFIYTKTQIPYMIEITAESVSLEGFRIWDNCQTSHRKSIFYISENADNVKIIKNVINGSFHSKAMIINNVNNTIINSNVINNTNGILIQNCLTTSIVGNSIQNYSTGDLIKILNSNFVHIENNVIRNSNRGLYLLGCNKASIISNRINDSNLKCLYIDGGEYNKIDNNTILETIGTGLDISSSDYFNISNNTISECSDGLTIKASKGTIYNNIISKCIRYGLYLISGSDNCIYNNNFTNKLGDFHVRDLTGSGNNQYYKKTYVYNQTLGVNIPAHSGNYWGDFRGPNPNNKNNLVTYKKEENEVPDVYIYKKGGVLDKYPLGVYNKDPEILITDKSPYPKHLAEGVELQPHLSVKIKDAEKERMDVDFYLFNYITNESTYIDTDYNVESGQTASVPFFSPDQSKNAVYTYLGVGYDYIGLWYVNISDSFTTTSSDRWIFSTKNTPLNNQVPISHAGGTYNAVQKQRVYNGKPNEYIQFNGTKCNDADGEIIFYHWNFGDGDYSTNIVKPEHKYESEGIFIATLTVIDNNGSSATDKVKVITSKNYTSDVIPNANAGGPYTGKIGIDIIFDGSKSKDPDNTNILQNYTWNFGDSSIGYGIAPKHSYKSAGDYEITLKITDDENNTDIAKTTVKIEKNKNSNNSPGFQILILILAISFTVCYYKRKKY